MHSLITGVSLYPPGENPCYIRDKFWLSISFVFTLAWVIASIRGIRCPRSKIRSKICSIMKGALLLKSKASSRKIWGFLFLACSCRLQAYFSGILNFGELVCVCCRIQFTEHQVGYCYHNKSNNCICGSSKTEYSNFGEESK